MTADRLRLRVLSMDSTITAPKRWWSRYGWRVDVVTSLGGWETLHTFGGTARGYRRAVLAVEEMKRGATALNAEVVVTYSKTPP